MQNFDLKFQYTDQAFPMIYIEGTGPGTFRFGAGDNSKDISIRDFFISKFPVTQWLWESIVGVNPANHNHPERPVECVSYDDIVSEGGFLERINADPALREQLKAFVPGRLRLPSESEWEYAARGGVHWKDGFIYSGSNDIDEVAWYLKNSGNETHPVGLKRANQLGIFDMNGNVWEWCHDHFTRDVNAIPADGSPNLGESPDRVLRGGCFHNMDIHSTSTKRYEIGRQYGDPCIGFRLVLTAG